MGKWQQHVHYTNNNVVQANYEAWDAKCKYLEVKVFGWPETNNICMFLLLDFEFTWIWYTLGIFKIKKKRT